MTFTSSQCPKHFIIFNTELSWPAADISIYVPLTGTVFFYLHVRVPGTPLDDDYPVWCLTWWKCSQKTISFPYLISQINNGIHPPPPLTVFPCRLVVQPFTAVGCNKSINDAKSQPPPLTVFTRVAWSLPLVAHMLLFSKWWDSKSSSILTLECRQSDPRCWKDESIIMDSKVEAFLLWYFGWEIECWKIHSYRPVALRFLARVLFVTFQNNVGWINWLGASAGVRLWLLLLLEFMAVLGRWRLGWTCCRGMVEKNRKLRMIGGGCKCGRWRRWYSSGTTATMVLQCHGTDHGQGNHQYNNNDGQA